MSFYAYSPLCGAFLTKTKEEVIDGARRFNTDWMGGMYDQIYTKPACLDLLAHWEEIAKNQRCLGAELAYRWIVHYSALKAEPGDGITIGASTFEQFEVTLHGVGKDPLVEEVVKNLNGLWDIVKDEALLDVFSK